ncbi:hypothetical protein B0H13DRAFT_2464446, partial [Mycena leptocephala]
PRCASAHPNTKVYPDPRSVRPPYPRRKKTVTPGRIRTNTLPRSHDDEQECEDEGVVRRICTRVHVCSCVARMHTALAAHEGMTRTSQRRGIAHPVLVPAPALLHLCECVRVPAQLEVNASYATQRGRVGRQAGDEGQSEGEGEGGWAEREDARDAQEEGVLRLLYGKHTAAKAKRTEGREQGVHHAPVNEDAHPEPSLVCASIRMLE